MLCVHHVPARMTHLVFALSKDLDHTWQSICSSKSQLEDFVHCQGQHDLQYGGPKLWVYVLLLLQQLDEFKVAPRLPVT